MVEQTGRAMSEASYQRLLGYLEHDPDNHALLADAAEAAIAAGRADAAVGLLDRAAARSAPGPRERNLAGLAAMHSERFADAAAIFSALLDGGIDSPAIRFNLAWSRAVAGNPAGALDTLDAAVCEALPEAAALDVRLRHAAGQFEDAYQRGKRYLDIHPDNAALGATMSVLALDMNEPDLAAAWAAKAPGNPDALTTLGTLALDGSDASQAKALFDEALARNPKAPRAWVGRGLAELLAGQTDRAPADIDRGAELFGSHLGSWIAAGWAYFVMGDMATSRQRFEHALALDPTFAETHGSLAVLDLLAGDMDSARDRAKVAARLDRQSYSAALAQAMMSAGQGDAEKSRAIIERALHTPLDGTGRTLAQALARMGAGAATIQ